MSTTPIYTLRTPGVFDTLETSSDGLSAEEARARLALYGPNALRESKAVPQWRRFAGHVLHPMALLLFAGGLIALAEGRPELGIVIASIVLVNAGFSFWREYRAEQAVTGLKQLLPSYARAIRSGVEAQIPASAVVPGDVLVLAEGDNIPADARVVEEYGLRVNNANLTGEAVPARKTAEASLHDGLTELEQPNLVFAGTSVVSGTGRAVVFATGMLTQFGRIANLTQAVEEPPSLLQQQLRQMTRLVTLTALGLGALVFLVGALEVGIPRSEAFILAIGLIVAVVPEGLAPTVALSLAIAVQRLARRGVLVKKLATAETLGTISVICTDKSGTLTQNQMTARRMWVAGQRFSVSGAGYAPEGEFSPSPAKTQVASDLNTLLGAALLCNNARLNPPTPEQPQWTCLGDQTEAALQVLALKGGVNERTLKASYPRIHELPFDARRKRMTTIHKDEGGRMRDEEPSGSLHPSHLHLQPAPAQVQASLIPHPSIAIVKGAPKEVLQLCTHILIRGEVRPLDHQLRAEIVAANDEYARHALRVIAFARRGLPPREGHYTPESVERNLTFLGLVAMLDPPRPEVAETVKTCRAAGIRMVMITGDYGLTAASVARRVGLLSTANPRILTGADIDARSDAELQALLAEEIIFARMAPDHKLRLVAAFQARGEVVAVIGDGVNDAPALRKADIGIAMGRAGTDVARQAADVIITDDNFSAIAHAIEEGRTAYHNLRKFLTYIFASNVPEIVPFIFMALFNIPLALTVTQVLAIDLGTDLLPALALGAERPEPDVMRRPPRRRGHSPLDRSLIARALWLGAIETALCYVGFFLVLNGAAGPITASRPDLLPFPDRLAAPGGLAYVLATTVFHAGVVAAQIGNAFACRTEKSRVRDLGWLSNRFLLLGVAVEVVIIALLIYVLPLAGLFEHAPLPPVYWLGLMFYAPALYLLEWSRKRVAQRIEQVRVRRRQGVVLA
ncbi:MAG TPA: cation-transporting P-type ATPase [Anaerolineae bacterium]|nr:cation-transporting P-type ATPase [Anaerolineae bacterium]